MRRARLFAAIALVCVIAAQGGFAADNVLTAEEKAAGWQLLFDGTQEDFEKHWVRQDGKAFNAKVPVQEDGITAFGTGGYLVVYKVFDDNGKEIEAKSKFEDFILQCDVKMYGNKGGGCNSGIFIRTSDLRNVVQSGLEVQVTNHRGTGSHHHGSIYDLAKPVKPAPEPKPEADGWDHVVITCKGPVVEVEMNGEHLLTMNCDEYTEAKKNPDGTKNKFRKAIKEWERNGYIGFQDHHDGSKAVYKNIKIKRLK